MARCVQAGLDRACAASATWGRLRSADFAIALATPALARSPHFVLHHVAAAPTTPSRQNKVPLMPELSTNAAPKGSLSVDNLTSPGLWWLGLVVPKRHARRAVTRSQLKRQMRIQADGRRCSLPAGQWIIRLRASFDARRYASAASPQLGTAARIELEQLFAGVASA